MKRFINRFLQDNYEGSKPQHKDETYLLAIGKMMSDHVRQRSTIQSIRDVEFKIFSQWGDDGIIQWLIHHLDIQNEIFIEFGVSDYRESNTRFLLINNNWSGFVMDGSKDNIDRIVNSEYYWKYDLEAKAAFIDRENINSLLKSSLTDTQVGLLHIDLDGNDYWIWEEINVVNPDILILEYNSIFGAERPITVPYDPKFDRTRAHYSNHYFGASLPALVRLSKKKGYAFIGCNSAGNNAFFVRSDLLKDPVREVTVANGFVMAKARESRNQDGELTFISGSERLGLIRGLPVFNIDNGEVETI